MMSMTKSASMPPLVRKEYAFEVKSVADAGDTSAAGLGTFDGAASVYNVIDLHGDVIAPGAFDDTLSKTGPDRVLLWQHYIDSPIGMASFVDSAPSLDTTGTPNGEVKQAQEAMALVRQGAIKGLSIGFNITGEEWDGGIRTITGVDLWEVSVVTFPANPLANITSAKNAHMALTELKARQVINAGADHVKAGKVLSSANRKQLQGAIEALQSVLDADSGESKDANDTVRMEQVMADLFTEIRSYRRS